MLRQLIYVSTARTDIRGAELERILATSRTNNARMGITGLLVHDSRRFLQYIEGEATAIIALYTRIAADPRHYGCEIIRQSDGETRQFGGWTMASGELADAGEFDSLVAQVTAATQGCDPLTSAHLRGFARTRAA